MRAQAIKTANFMYDLPSERIAQRPVPIRHDAKLLVVRRNRSPLQHAKFTDLPDLLPSSALLVRNVSRVIPARIEAMKRSGGRAQVFLLHPSNDVEPHHALSAAARNQSWNVLLGGRKIANGDRLTAESPGDGLVPPIRLEITIDSKLPAPACVSLNSCPELPLRIVLERLGATPLPPYIRRPVETTDRTSYAPVYAKQDGSVAAPTAGLHFTPSVLTRLTQRNIQFADIVLHVGLGTFRPVSTPTIASHDMHCETISVPGYAVKQMIDHILQCQPIIALVRYSFSCS